MSTSWFPQVNMDVNQSWERTEVAELEEESEAQGASRR